MRKLKDSVGVVANESMVLIDYGNEEAFEID